MSRGFVWSMLSMVISVSAGLILTPQMIKALGPADFGLYLLVLNVASYFGVMDFGLTWAATKYFASDIQRADLTGLKSRFRTLQIFFLGVGVVCFLVCVLFGPAIMKSVGSRPGSSLVAALGLGAIAFALSLQGQLHASLLRAAQRFEQPGRAVALGAALLPAATLVILRTRPGIVLLLAANVAVNSAILFYYQAASRPLLSASPSSSATPRRERWDPAYLGEMARFGGWATICGLTMLVMLQMDKLAVAFIGTIAGVTFYAVPAGLAARVSTIGSMVPGLFFARASHLFASGERQQLACQYAQTIRMLIWTALALCLPVVALGPKFLGIWISPEMEAKGGPVLVVFAIANAMMAVGATVAVTIEASGRMDWSAKNMLTWAVVAILGVLFFAPRAGVQAMAYGIASWLILVSLTNLIWISRFEERGFGEAFRCWPGVIITVVAGVPIARLAQPYITTVASGLALLGGVGVVTLGLGYTVVLNADDRDYIKRFIARPVGWFASGQPVYATKD